MYLDSSSTVSVETILKRPDFFIHGKKNINHNNLYLSNWANTYLRPSSIFLSKFSFLASTNFNNEINSNTFTASNNQDFDRANYILSFQIYKLHSLRFIHNLINISKKLGCNSAAVLLIMMTKFNNLHNMLTIRNGYVILLPDDNSIDYLSIHNIFLNSTKSNIRKFLKKYIINLAEFDKNNYIIDDNAISKDPVYCDGILVYKIIEKL
jgi:hypothetical protein